MPDYVNNNDISGTSQQLRSTRYQVPGMKKEKRQGKTEKTEKEKRKMEQNKHALREQAES